MDKLMTRDEFREAVFKRDGYTCIFCPEKAADAHHVLERRLWSSPGETGGYFLNNGASVCNMHHMECEKTTISVEQVREAAKILKPVIPSHLYDDQVYDKWGNSILPNGTRLRGELFYDESVQKVLKEGGVLELFVEYVKYPRTHHVPWSPGFNPSDRMLDSMRQFVGKRVVVTEKLDGENTSLYRDYTHARSLDGRHHESRDWVKQFWNQKVRYQIPDAWRICGENMYAEHSIAYKDLKSYFYAFSMWDERNYCLDWDTSVMYWDVLGIEHVPVLFDGIYDEKAIKALYNPAMWHVFEGYTIRVADGFPYSDFKKSIAKFVRKGHIQTSKHWMHGSPVKPNALAK